MKQVVGGGHGQWMLAAANGRRAEGPRQVSNRRDLALLAAIVVLGVAWRVSVLGVDGHNGDVLVMTRWAERMADVGPWPFYEGSGSVYPALLYPLWGLGVALDGPALDLAVKALSIPFDVAIGLLLAAALWRRSGPGEATTAAALYMLNPAAILAGPVWGQVDSAGTLPFMASLVALASGRHGVAGGLGVIAFMVKPQFGLVLLPVVVVAAMRSRQRREVGPALRAVGGMAATYALMAAPLALHPPRYLQILSDTATRQPYTSLNAFNPWGLLIGFEVPDGPFVLVGTLLLLAGCIGSLTPLRRQADLAAILAVGALLVLAFYFLPTRVHERYLFPAIAVLAPLALAGRPELLAYAGVTIGFAGSLLYALVTTTPFTLPEPMAAAVTSPIGVWAIGLLLMASALVWTWRLGFRSPRLPRPPDVPPA